MGKDFLGSRKAVEARPIIFEWSDEHELRSTAVGFKD